MKTAVILLGLLVTFAVAEEKCPLLLELERGFEECKESMNPSEETLGHFAAETGADNRDVQCFEACIVTKIGWMEGLKFNVEKMESLLRSVEKPDEEKINLLVPIFTECKGEAEISTDECEVAGKYLNCVNVKYEAAQPER